MIICRKTEKLCLTNVRRFSQQTMEAHFDIQITAKEVPRIFCLNSDMSVATQKIMYGCLTSVQSLLSSYSVVCCRKVIGLKVKINGYIKKKKTKSW